MPRLISDFNGSGVVIGCSHYHRCCSTKHLHDNIDVFYSIDLNADHKPDFVFNITHELPPAFKNRFKLTLLEHIDFTVYNKSNYNSSKGVKGFDNIFEMTAEDGFIVIVGCPREQMFRERVTQLNLSYIELDEEHQCILIPKNQNLSFDAVQKQIEMLDQTLQSTIKGAKEYNKKKPNLESNFCQFAYKDMPVAPNAFCFQVKEQRKQTKEPQPQQAEVNINSSPITNISLMVINGFIAAVGITAVAIAFTVLNAATFGVAGIVLATIGLILALSGMGLFVASAYKNRQKTDEDSAPEQDRRFCRK